MGDRWSCLQEPGKSSGENRDGCCPRRVGDAGRTGLCDKCIENKSP